MGERKFDASVLVHPTAVWTGNVSVGKGSSLWPHSSMRGDFDSIAVGEHTSIQDCCVLHAAPGRPVKVGSYVTVGHGAVLHGCTVEDECVIGINSVVLDGAVVGRGTIVAAGAVVKAGEQVPAGSFVAGVPGVVKPGKPGQEQANRVGALSYSVLARTYLEGKETIGAAELFSKMAEHEKRHEA
jgi:carbonic anhydrase/acetyltransferase-like protein (isoleucine patch superfamily)